MTLLHTIAPNILIPSGLLREGITALPDVTVTLDGTITCSALKVGATPRLRGDAGENKDGKELVDERWVEVNDGSGWTPIGGGPGGDTLAITASATLQARLNIPAGYATTGDFLANLELFYVE